MSEHHFGVVRRKLSASEIEKRDKIARAHGASFVFVNLPGQGPLGWFAGPNRGYPFDDALEQRVRSSLDAAGVKD